MPPWFEHSVLVKQVPFRGEAFLKQEPFAMVYVNNLTCMQLINQRTYPLVLVLVHGELGN